MGDLRGRWIRAPWWVAALAMGAFFGVFMGLFQLLQGASAPAAAIGGVASGVLFGAVTGPLTHRTNARWLAAVADVPADRQGQVRRAAWRGPAPTDPVVRAAALGVVTQQLARTRRQPWAAPMWAAFIALALWLAWSDSTWWVLGALFFAGFLALQLWTPRHLRDRQRVLADG